MSDRELIPIVPRGTQHDDQEKFSALPKAEQRAWLKTRGVPFRRDISLWKVPTALLPQTLPVNVPLHTTLAEYTKGDNGRITSWFNPAMTRWKGQNWMCFRMECHPFWKNGRMAMVRMTDDWAVVPKSWHWLNLQGFYGGFAESQDARFLVYKGILTLPFNDGKRQRMAVLNDECVPVKEWVYEADFQFTEREKNWSFFTHGDDLFCLYQTCPHIVCSAVKNQIRKVSCTDWLGDYEFGRPRGGATPVLHNGVYYHFFHSSTRFDTGENSERWAVKRRYHIGLSLFSPEPPFKPVAKLDLPIMSGWEEVYKREHYPYEHLVLFPGSAHRDGDAWVIGFGLNDHDACMARIPDRLIEPLLL